MAQKTVKTWRKATEEELLNGSSEMILFEETTIEVDIPDREVPLWRVKGILKIMKLDAAIDDALEQLDEPIKTLAISSWSNGSVINQNSQTVKFIQSVIGLTDEQVNDVFNQAEAIII